MRDPGSLSARSAALWALAALLGGLALYFLYPHAFPLTPGPWELTRGEAETLATENLRELSPIPAGSWTVVHLSGQPELERRLQRSLARGSLDSAALRGTPLADQVLAWDVTVYPPGAYAKDWSHRARLALDGRVLALEQQSASDASTPDSVPADPSVPETGSLLPRAEAFLLQYDIDPASFGEPEVRSQDLGSRTEVTLRYSLPRENPEPAMPERVSLEQGVEVRFAGDQLLGFAHWFEDPELPAIKSELQTAGLMQVGHIALVLVALLVVAVFFMRRYHAGEIGVRTGLLLFAVSAGAGLLCLVLVAPGATQGFGASFFTRRQITWVWASQIFCFYFLPLAAVTLVSWSVGESFCRERWSSKLAAFDGLLRGHWRNSTVARSALRGVVAGWVTAALLLALVVLIAGFGAGPQLTSILDWTVSSPAFPLAQLSMILVAVLFQELLARLLLVPPLVRRLGGWAGSAVVVLLSALFFSPLLPMVPYVWGVAVSGAFAAAMVFLFLRYDLLTTLLASLTVQLLPACLVLLRADDPALQLQGWLPLLVASLPLLVGLRFVTGDEELVYRYDDVPPHVRRIAERERQRLELETARGIQSSILPKLPSVLAGVEIAHAYRPATEVGGDFYDVLELEDGRLAVAVGDVAGHGVSSGLIMSMTKSALAVQVAYDPEVAPVFATLNRMVYQSARRRLLTTLCYALVDPRSRQVLYASAGHLFPYRLSPTGGAEAKVEALESVAYPLGARPELELRARSVELEAGDLLFLFSDGLVEAQAQGTEEVFGFERLERSLACHAHRGVAGLRDGVLADLGAFAAGSPRHDDQTVVVLRVP
jgi:hypothetical protein